MFKFSAISFDDTPPKIFPFSPVLTCTFNNILSNFCANSIADSFSFDFLNAFDSCFAFNLLMFSEFASTAKGKELIKNTDKELAPLKIHRMRKQVSSFVTVDIETTGLNDMVDKIIQIAAVKYVDNKRVDEFNTYVNPGEDNLPLSEFIVHHTGIQTYQLKNAPSLKEISKSFIEFVDSLPWIGHNIYKFDIPFLYESGIGINEFYAIDTYNIAKRKLDRSVLKSLSLPTLKKYYGIPGKSHNALDDCRTTAIVYKHLRDDHLDEELINSDKNTKALDNIHFLVIGDFAEMSNYKIKVEISKRGGIADSRYNKKVKYFVNGFTKNNYKSAQNAKNNNVKLLNYLEFITLLNQKDKEYSKAKS